MALGVTQANASVCSRVYNFADGSILTASQLNTEFNTAINCVNSINESNVSPNASFSPVNINAIVAGDGLGRDSATGALSVNVDASTIAITGDTLGVPNSGIVTSKIADSNVTTAKIADSNVTTAKLNDEAVTAAKIVTSVDLNGFVKAAGRSVVVASTNPSSNLAIIRGNVNADGTIHAGEGFTVTKGSSGVYTINFSTGYFSEPTLTVSPVGHGFSFVSPSVYSFPTTGSAVINLRWTNGGSNTLVDDSFSFIAIGIRN